MRIAVIVPVLNEQDHILQTLESLQAWRCRGHEVILVDGGSTDRTVELATAFVDTVLISQPGRALQMNVGEESTSAEILLFLHADTVISENADQLIINAVTTGHRWGRFSVKFDSPRWIFKLIARLMNLRSCMTSIVTGDQAMFVEHQLFDQIGRFPVLPLMEDIQISINLKRFQRTTCLSEVVTTSARRWEKNGVIATVLLMWTLRLAYFSGVSVTRLHKIYYR